MLATTCPRKGGILGVFCESTHSDTPSLFTPVNHQYLSDECCSHFAVVVLQLL